MNFKYRKRCHNRRQNESHFIFPKSSCINDEQNMIKRKNETQLGDFFVGGLRGGKSETPKSIYIRKSSKLIEPYKIAKCFQEEKTILSSVSTDRSNKSDANEKLSGGLSENCALSRTYKMCPIDSIPLPKLFQNQEF